MTEELIGKMLANARYKKGDSPLDIKKNIKLQPFQLTAIETASSNYTIKSLQTLCDYLGMEVLVKPKKK